MKKSDAERAEQQAFYHSKEWKQVRQYVLMRDGYLCQYCGKPATEVHHKRHLDPSTLYDVTVNLNPDNLVSLCRACHQDQHRMDRGNGLRQHPVEQVLPSYHFDSDGNIVPD